MSVGVILKNKPLQCGMCTFCRWISEDDIMDCRVACSQAPDEHEFDNLPDDKPPDWCPLQEVEPVRHGHWKALRGDWDGLYECQECGNRFGTPYCYCPVCGVKMDCVDGGAE